MITQYHRPKTLTEALALIAQPKTYPLGGGILLNRFSNEEYAVVDLQSLELNTIVKDGDSLQIGATATLEELLNAENTPDALKKAIRHEAALNTRNLATVAGALVASDGRSPFATTMMALDAKITLKNSKNEEENIQLGDFLPLREETVENKLIVAITIPLTAQLAYEYVARTPKDKAIISAGLTKWSSGRTRLVLGGWGKSPSLAMDGKGAEGIESAAKNAAHDANDEWASAEYRQDVAVTLAKRCLAV